MNDITSQDLEDAANLFIMTVNAYVGFDKSALEVAGAAHTVLNIAIQELNKNHEQTTKIGEGESVEGTATGPEQVQAPGEQRRLSAGSEGTVETNTAKAPTDRPQKRNSKSGKRTS